ncbi:hypothetical protein Tsubulata_010633 [Turnera subulata]|uniref:Uncharacterized protein n=1 Tax=Turnera subulata TaxID=218843 RepID=A0A9Q0FGV6_9ROSI|nr:hypothetical protein Tsubulata_010633 [Turnera subulata]
MSRLPEITGLFADLALHLRTIGNTSPVNHQHHQPERENPSLDLSISKLAQSLNLTDNSRVRVLDTALSLMCFKAPQVFDSVIEYSVDTIVTVLNSSVTCKALLLDKEEILQSGSSISRRGIVELIDVVEDIVSKLDSRGMPSHQLLRAFARVAVSASCCGYLAPSMHISDFPPIHGNSTTISKLLCHLPRDFSLEDNEIPLRLLFWYLQPLTLKHDISKILQESIKRPFLSLSKGFLERTDWRSILLCLVLSPTMFIDTRALLHDWFLLMGLGSILEVLVELVSVMLDVISRPGWWGLSVDLGSRLPFLNAYFPYKLQWLKALAGTICPENLLQLVQCISEAVPIDMKQCSSTVRPSAMVTSVDNRSIWSLAINFPDWFYLASFLLFHGNRSFQDIFQSKCTNEATRVGQECSLVEPAVSAASYIAWILSPADKSHQDMLFDALTKISNSWTRKQVGSGTDVKGTSVRRKKLKQSKTVGSKQDCSVGADYDCQFICFWLEQFQKIMKFDNKSVDGSAACKASFHVPRNNMLLRRIPLGILIGSACSMNEDGCELLLHYIATGRILYSIIGKNANSKQKQHIQVGSGVSNLGSDECHKRDYISGACLVFSLTDIVERLSTIFESEEIGLEFICQVKLRTCRYLIKCIKRLLLPPPDNVEVLMLMDLHARLEGWRHQGKRVLQLDKEIESSINSLKDITA